LLNYQCKVSEFLESFIAAEHTAVCANLSSFHHGIAQVRPTDGQRVTLNDLEQFDFRTLWLVHSHGIILLLRHWSCSYGTLGLSVLILHVSFSGRLQRMVFAASVLIAGSFCSWWPIWRQWLVMMAAEIAGLWMQKHAALPPSSPCYVNSSSFWRHNYQQQQQQPP